VRRGVCRRRAVVQVVQHVIGVEADLELEALSQIERLAEAEIHSEEARPDERIPAQSAREIGRRSEGVRGGTETSKPGAQANRAGVAVREIPLRESRGRLRNDCRTLQVIGLERLQGSAVENAEREPCVEEDVARDLPTSNGQIRQMAFRLKRQRINVIGADVVTDVVIRRSVTGIGVERIHLVENAVDYAERVDATVGIGIERVGVRIIEASRQPVPIVLHNRDSDPIVIGMTCVRQLEHVSDTWVRRDGRQA